MLRCLSILLLILPAAAGEAAQRVLLDAGWRFHAGDTEHAQADDCDDSRWRSVDLPHDWSIEQATDPDAASGAAGGYFPTGVGWYRKSFEIPAEWQERHVWIDFEGVYQQTEVWLNGTRLGNHAYGYTPFRFKLTDHLKTGETNTLAVRVDNSQQPNCRWYSGSGIYRHVWLTANYPVHFAHESLHVVTERASADEATLRVAAVVKNESHEPQRVSVEFAWVHPDRSSGGGVAQGQMIAANEQVEVSHSMTVSRPQLWSPEHPALYRLTARIVKDGETLDEESIPCGIRTVMVDLNRGLLLNGEPIELFGGNVHHDNGPLGAAAFDRAEERRAELLKAAGFNAVRTAHNPPSTAFLNACDRLGLLVIDEAFDGWRKSKLPHDYGAFFADNWREDLRAMILRDRNHPSVVMWSIGNEMYERGDPQAVNLAREMVELVRRHDRSRPVTAGVNGLGSRRDWSELNPLFAELDVAGYNYESHRFADDHQRVPDRVMLSSESYPGEIESSRRVVVDNAYVIGDFVWSAMDYLGEAGIGRVFPPGVAVQPHWEGSHYPWHGGTCGDIDITGRRKPISHFRNIAWNRGEKLYAAVVRPAPGGGDWNLSRWATPPWVASWTWPGHEGDLLDVEVCCRWPLARLEINGRVIAEWKPDAARGHRATLAVEYEVGEVVAIGLDEDGTEQEQFTLETAGPAAAIHLTPDRPTIAADGQDLSFVEVEVRNAAGTVCPLANNSIHYEVTGPARIVGIGSGDLSSREPYIQNPRRVHAGRALVVLRSTNQAGKISLRAEGHGLQARSIAIESRNRLTPFPDEGR